MRAAAMVHRVPCVGFSVEEAPRPGRLRAEAFEPLVERNAKQLEKELGRSARSVFRELGALKEGESFVFPDGTRVAAEEVRGRRRRGRKVAICGDTSDASLLAPLAAGADVVIHEATNAYIPGLASTGGPAEERRHAANYGHSTPDVAGEFAARCGAERLVLTHFSPRFRGDDRPENLEAMYRIEEYAREAAGLRGEAVIAAWDLMVLPVPPRDEPADEPAGGGGADDE